MKNRIFFRVLIICICIGCLLSACNEKQDNNEKFAGKTPEEILKEGQKELEEKTAEILKRSEGINYDDLGIDLSEYEYYNRRDNEDAEKYYPTLSTSFDDYSRYSYSGPDVVGEKPQSYEDMKDRVDAADKNDDKYLYKGRKEDLFTRSGYDSVEMHDSAPYKYIFGYDKPSIEVLYRTLDNNDNIPNNYKAVFREQIEEWMTQNPGIDLTLLNENLYTLDLMECTSRQLLTYSMSMDALACYRKEENTIYVLEGSSFDDEFKAILRHEFAHAARSYISVKGNDIQILTGFCTSVYPALFTEESLTTLFTSYENLAHVYPLVVNCYRVVIDNCNYTCSDYMNHSIYELRDKVNYYLGDIVSADELIKGIEAIGQFIYDPIDKAKYNITEDNVKGALKLVIKIALNKNPELSPSEVLDMLKRDISKPSSYESFLNESVIEEMCSEIKSSTD